MGAKRDFISSNGKWEVVLKITNLTILFFIQKFHLLIQFQVEIKLQTNLMINKVENYYLAVNLIELFS